MKLFKRITAFALALVMGAGVLAGCGDTEEEEPNEPQEPKVEITVARASSSKNKYGDVKLYELEELETSSPDGNIVARFGRTRAADCFTRLSRTARR